MEIRQALTFDDVMLVPAASGILPADTDTGTRLTREIEKLDAALADGGLFTRDPAKAAATAKSRAECANALAKAEEDWLAAGSALEAAE